MYYFLAIVETYNVQQGIYIPSFTLCQSHGASETRSGWRVAKTGSTLENMTKVLVASMIGHSDMIDFMCSYRTRDHMHGDKRYSPEETKKYYPEGVLCWFPCDIYGERAGPAVIIQKVPQKKGTDAGFKRLLDKKKPTIPQLLSKDSANVDLQESHKKPRLYNSSTNQK